MNYSGSLGSFSLKRCACFIIPLTEGRKSYEYVQVIGEMLINKFLLFLSKPRHLKLLYPAFIKLVF